MSDEQTNWQEIAEKFREDLQTISYKLAEHGVAPEGPYVTHELVGKVIEDYAVGRQKLHEIAEKLAEAGLVTEATDGLDAIDQVVSRYKQLEGERETLQAQVDALTAKEEAAALADQKKAKAVPQKRSEKARKIGPIKLKEGQKPPTASEILELISAAETVEIAFSDGAAEVSKLAPRQVMGDAWIIRGSQLLLSVPEFELYGPNRDEAPVHVAGYGLLIDGELAAYGPRPEPLTVVPGAKYELKDDIVFNF